MSIVYDIAGLSADLQAQILGNQKNVSLFSRFPDKLLGLDTNAKTVKGEKYGVKTAILYLMPSNKSGAQLCPMAALALCADPCLFVAGRGAMSNVMLSRLRKTLFFLQFREQFMRQLHNEILALRAKAKRDGFKLLVRLNGTSDIRWENIPVASGLGISMNIFDVFGDVQFYDYTKIPNRKNIPENYDLTFSYSGATQYGKFVERAVQSGQRIAVVFRNRATVDAMLSNGDKFLGLPIVDGDDSDIRHLDPKAAVVALYAKGKARHDKSGFVVG